MLEYSLDEFIITVPICSQTITLADVLSTFESESCERLVVVSKFGCPVGIIYSANLLPQLLAATQDQPVPNLQSQLSSLDVINTIRIVSISANIQEFSQVLHSPSGSDGVVVVTDTYGKYVGLLDSNRLLKHLNKLIISNNSNNGTKIKKQSSARASKKNIVNATSRDQQYQSLVKLLERLPWPLMLQTSSGDVVTQNPAWWQQLGGLKDPEGVRQEVETILSEEIKSHHSSSNVIKTSPNAQPTSKKRRSKTKNNRCVLDSQLGTCTCVVEVQSGQERVWQFAKIPLDSPEIKALEQASVSEAITPSNIRQYINVAEDLHFSSQSSYQPHVSLLNDHQLKSVAFSSSDLWLTLATDVTEQQQLSKELAAKNADLIQMNRLKDEFLACISHELKTPLTAVLGLSRLLIDQQLGELNERQARYAGLIHQSGRHLMSVVNDILDLTRMETGQMELLLGTVKIKNVCDLALTESKAVHASTCKVQSDKTHEFNLVIEPGIEEIIADEQRLRQMLVHLLSNAFKFTEGGGKVGLRVNYWEGWVAFTVWDTGIGIPEHQQHLIFQKFQQLENPLTRQFEGTGLGLVLTRALARLHGGDVSFLSREGKGSQFTLLLPPSPPKADFTENSLDPHGRRELATETLLQNKFNNHQQPTNIRHQSFFDAVPSAKNSFELAGNIKHHDSSQRLILLVEAVGRYIEELTEHLTGMGYRVAIARSGCEAVEKARRLQPKAIFLNPLLPLLSGWDVLTLLKSEEATRHIPVIVTATVAEKEQAFANRADGFLRLPVQHQMLLPLLDSLSVTPEIKKRVGESIDVAASNVPLRILRLVNPNIVSNQPSLIEHRIIEVDDLEQAELLARVWQFDVMLLDAPIETAKKYLETISQHPRLSTLPLVTCNVEVFQAASQIAGLSVFPCLTPLGNDDSDTYNINTLLSVLQIAAGVSCPPSILVVDLAILPDLPERNTHLRSHRVEKHSLDTSISTGKELLQGVDLSSITRGSEWMQALIQYLQTGGFKAASCRSWSELLQQIRHRSIDLLVICLEESAPEKQVISALKTLNKLPFNLPPILILDRRVNVIEKQDNLFSTLTTCTSEQPKAKTLPRSISMEDLLHEIHEILK
ncbi:CBS sensor hybrid histidine kinase [Calothrix sp. NIES-4071]|nr:CBS sensor hybrid histidine kinase [Calothrix sp. NIES-4071]BAZ64267.1 CBS sensor hybrid histidine kinase [Calothrix sp. NIES-4105]